MKAFNKETHDYLQHVFNLGWQKFVVEFAPKAFEENTGCKYKDANGNRCLIGLTIPVGHKAEHFRGGVSSLWIEFPELRPAFVNSSDISDAQVYLHDTINPAATQEERREIYQDFAIRHSLTIPQET